MRCAGEVCWRWLKLCSAACQLLFEEVNKVLEVLSAVLPLHVLQDFIGAGLNRNMKE